MQSDKVGLCHFASLNKFNADVLFAFGILGSTCLSMNKVLSIFASDEDHVRNEEELSLHRSSNVIDGEDNTREMQYL